MSVFFAFEIFRIRQRTSRMEVQSIFLCDFNGEKPLSDLIKDEIAPLFSFGSTTPFLLIKNKLPRFKKQSSK